MKYTLAPGTGPAASTRARIFKLLCGPRIDTKEPIPPAYVVWRADRATLFLFGS
jgi:hypothetical protein